MSGRVKIEDAESYLKAIGGQWIPDRRIAAARDFSRIVRNRALRYKRASDRIEAIKPLVREIAGRAQP